MTKLDMTQNVGPGQSTMEEALRVDSFFPEHDMHAKHSYIAGLE